MNVTIALLIALGLPVLFVAIWLLVTSLLGLASGWYALARAFPDRPETAQLRLTGETGYMGAGVHMGGVLSLSVCPSGLRVGISKLLGPFCGDFLVPWGELSAHPKKAMFVSLVALEFAAPPVGRLDIRPDTAQRLARAAGDRWPGKPES
jgi:hypothetical protein